MPDDQGFHSPSKFVSEGRSFLGSPNKSFIEQETANTRRKRTATTNLKSFLVQSCISVLCFIEFYHTPFDVFVKERKHGAYAVWMIGILFLFSSFVCLLCYFVYCRKIGFKSNMNTSHGRSSPLWTPTKQSAEKTTERHRIGPSVFPKRESTNDFVFNCVRLSPNNSSVGYMSPNHSQSSVFNRSGGPGNTSQLFNTSFTTGNQSFSGNTSFNRRNFAKQHYSPNSSFSDGGRNSQFRNQLNSSLSLRHQRNSLFSSAEQSFHLSPMASLSTSPNKSHLMTSDSPGVASDDVICDRQDLEKYLNSFYQQEAETLAALDGAREMVDSPQARMLKHLPNDKYQVSSNQLASEDNSNSANVLDMTNSSCFSTIAQSLDVVCVDGLKKYNINNRVQGWVEHFRKWISATVLKPLVKAISDSNKILEQNGIIEVKLGKSNVGSFSLLRQQNLNFTLIEKVLPYLDITSHQEYLCQRIKTLASGYCLSEFRWNGGCVFNNEAWNESLPSDADIILHCFLTYLDQHSISHASYVIENKMKALYYIPHASLNKSLKENKKILLAQVSAKPPTYVVVFKDKILQIAPGPYNLFHALLLFMFLHDRHNYGKMDSVALGSTGINLSWIFSS